MFMKIKHCIEELNKQIALGMTPKGRPITDDATAFIQATIEDKKNYESSCVTCKNCGMIWSSLLIYDSQVNRDGCPNCGSLDLKID